MASYVQQWANKQYCDISEKMRNPKHPVYCCIECGFVAHVSCTLNEVLPSVIEEYEKEAKLRENLKHDLGLQRINMRIQDDRDEEERLVAELEKITARLDILKVNRAEYVASLLPELNCADCSTTMQPSA
ncbi:uncharacterized protein LOC116198591 [Punica granatum]|nr:uncharacterized protein LOC116198591 [Punica granatum]